MSNLLGGYLSATFNPLSGAPTTVEYLVVAGGGGSGSNGGGGGAVGSSYGGIGGAGGTASGGDINIVGGKGQDGYANDLPSYVPASGGSSAFIGVTCAPGQSGSDNSGSGGGSQKSYGTAAGNGGSGLIIIEY